MTPEEFEAWLLGQPAVLAYLGILLLGSFIAFVIFVGRALRTGQLRTHPVPPWPLSALDFGLFMVALVLWFVLSGAILIEIYHWIAGADAEPGSDIMVLGGFLLQAGMLYLFLRFRFHHRSPGEGPLNPRLLSLGTSFGFGLYYFLASLPLVYGVGVIWNGLLEFLRNRGYNINLPMQDAVILFQKTENPWTFFGLIFLAVVVAPVVEETVFRAGIFRFLKGRTSLGVSLVISGTLFGLVHGNLQSLPGLITVGICLGFAYELSGNLRVPIFFHALFNLNSILWILIIPTELTG